MIKVGLTGNIGSGKTTVARIFEVLGVPVYYADVKAKEFLTHNTVKKLLQKKFGDKIFQNDGSIDKKSLAEIVFNDKKSLEYLNSVIHPLVRKDFQTWAEGFRSEPYVIQEAAILFESGFNTMFDKIITVCSDEELSIERVTRRDAVPRSIVLERMKNQWPARKKTALSDFVIYNDETQPLIPQVLEIHHRLTESKR